MSLLLCLNTLRINVSADEVQTATVQLTAAQTLALFGQSIPALYYDGSRVHNVTFDFVKSTRTICDNLDTIFTPTNDIPVLPSGSKNAFTMNAIDANGNAQNQLFDSQLYSNSSWLGVNEGSIIDRNKIKDYEFLFYKCSFSGFFDPVPSTSYDFQFNINFPISLSGVDGWQSIFGTQIGAYSASDYQRNAEPNITNVNYGSEIRLYSSSNSLTPLAVTSDSHMYGYNTKFGYGIHPINTCDPSYVGSTNPATFSALDACTSYFAIFSMQVMDESFTSSFDLSRFSWNIRNVNSQYRLLKQDFDPHYVSENDPNSSNYQYDDPTCYIMIMCPILHGEYTIGSGSGSGSGTDYSPALNDIIDKLDQIVENLNIDVDFDTTNLENTIVTTGNNIVSGIKNLFIPTQTDLINFRLDLEDEFHSFFPAMYTAESKIDSVFRALEDVSAVDYLMFPGVSVDLPAENGGSANFKIDSGAVLLKPAADRLSVLYDCLAIAIDIIATLAFFNMLRNRFNRFFGEGAEE